MTFTRELLERLGLGADTDGSDGRAPFELMFTDHHDFSWRETTTRTSAAEFAGRFVAADGGLTADLHARFFDDTRAVEVSGTVRNEGRDTFAGLQGFAALRLRLRLDPAWAEPLVRSWRGARTLPNFPSFFPPQDFEVQNRRLVTTDTFISPLALHAGADGRSSSEDLPFAVVAGNGGGLVLGVEWSGTWFLTAQQDPNPDREESRRFPLCVEAGLWGVGLDLRPGESLPLPTVLLAAYTGDAAAGGNALRRHLRRHVTPRLGGAETLPFTSFNHWFAFENDFTDASLRPAVDAAAAAGLEYFVVDAGWFPAGFPRGVGNWDEIDKNKFPDGVAAFSAYVRSKGMRFGTWFEPEHAHVDSSLHRRHPEWFFAPPRPTPPASYYHWLADGPASPESPRGGHLTAYRLLDFGSPEVREYWVDRITAAYQDWGMRWLRWDFTHAPLPRWTAADEPGWAQIRHVEGLYQVWDHLLETFPDLVIEQCAGGGNRIDLGTVRRGHTYWMSDHTTRTDLVRRMQTGLNQVLPGTYANTNLCQARHDFTDYDHLSHSCGSFGYSGRLWEAPAPDFRRYAEAVGRFKATRHLLLGDYSSELADLGDRFGHEIHTWRDAGQELVLEFNGPDGARTATATSNPSPRKIGEFGRFNLA